jgi:hypothetical protein
MRFRGTTTVVVPGRGFGLPGIFFRARACEQRSVKRPARSSSLVDQFSYVVSA